LGLLALSLSSHVAGDQAQPELQYILTTAWGERLVPASDVPVYGIFNRAVNEANPDLALAIYDEVLRLKPTLPEALINLSTLLTARRASGDVARAREALTLAVAAAEHRSLRAAAFSNLGHLEQKEAGKDLVKAAAAESHYQLALDADPAFVDALFNYGTLCDALGRYDDSSALYTLTLAAQPSHALARLNLANGYFHRGQHAEALRLQAELVAPVSGTPPAVQLQAFVNMGQVTTTSLVA
jgi:tetratricopeptide (TPR) repeat protein